MTSIGSVSSPTGATSGSASGTAPGGSATQGVISSLGIGTGMNLSALVTSLVQADTSAQQNQISTATQAANTQLSALGQLQAALSGIQAALAGLRTGTAFTSYTATAAGAAGANATFTASVGTGATAGTHTVVVNQLATAQQLSSAAFASSSSIVGTGTLVVAVGGKSVGLTIDSSNNTLQGIASAINGASNNPGVTASIINAADGAHLVLSSNSTGAANTITVTSSGGDGGLTAINYNPAGGGPNNLSVQTAAQDASLTIDGFAVTSASNSVSNVLSGVTLNLGSAAPGATQTLSVGLDTTGITNTLQGLVTAYNSYVAATGQLASYDPGSGTAGPLLGDATLQNVNSQMAGILGSVVGNSSASVQSLADIGINFNVDGTLSLDTNALNSALTGNPTQVAALFNGSNGYGAQLNNTLNSFLLPGGVFDNRTQAINQQLSNLAQQQSDLNQQIAAETTRYQQQFAAMDTLVAQLQSSSSAITQMLSGLNSTAILNTPTTIGH